MSLLGSRQSSGDQQIPQLFQAALLAPRGGFGCAGLFEWKRDVRPVERRKPESRLLPVRHRKTAQCPAMEGSFERHDEPAVTVVRRLHAMQEHGLDGVFDRFGARVHDEMAGRSRRRDTVQFGLEAEGQRGLVLGMRVARGHEGQRFRASRGPPPDRFRRRRSWRSEHPYRGNGTAGRWRLDRRRQDRGRPIPQDRRPRAMKRTDCATPPRARHAKPAATPRSARRASARYRAAPQARRPEAHQPGTAHSDPVTRSRNVVTCEITPSNTRDAPIDADVVVRMERSFYDARLIASTGVRPVRTVPRPHVCWCSACGTRLRRGARGCSQGKRGTWLP